MYTLSSLSPVAGTKSSEAIIEHSKLVKNRRVETNGSESIKSTMGEMDTAVTNDEPVKNTKVVGIMDSYQHESEATANNYQNNTSDITRPSASPANSKLIENRRGNRMDCGDDNDMEAGGDGSQDKPLPPQHEGKPKSLHCCHWSRGSYMY